jgi:hypothetical protein
LKARLAHEFGMSVVSETRVVLTDGEFVKLLRSEGVQTFPRFLTNVKAPDESGDGLSLDFVITWAFLAPLCARPLIASYLANRWSGFIPQARAAFAMLAANGAFSHAMTMHRFQSRPRGKRRLKSRPLEVAPSADS